MTRQAGGLACRGTKTRTALTRAGARASRRAARQSRHARRTRRMLMHQMGGQWTAKRKRRERGQRAGLLLGLQTGRRSRRSIRNARSQRRRTAAHGAQADNADTLSPNVLPATVARGEYMAACHSVLSCAHAPPCSYRLSRSSWGRDTDWRETQTFEAAGSSSKRRVELSNLPSPLDVRSRGTLRKREEG